MTHTFQKMHTIQEAITEHLPAERLFLKWLIVATTVLFCLYMYLVAVMVYKTVDRKIVEGHIRDTRVAVSDVETSYLQLSGKLDVAAAASYGFTVPKIVSFADDTAPALSLNTARNAF